MTEVLLFAGLALWMLGAAVDLVAGANRPQLRPLPYLAGVGGGSLVCAAGVLAVFVSARTVKLGSTLGVGQTLLHLDALAGIFLTLTAGLAVLISACMLSWTAPPGRVAGHGIGAGYLLLLGAVTVIIVAGDAFTFLFGWEALTVAFYVLTGISRSGRPSARASWVTFGVGKVSGAALLFGFLLLAGRAGSLTLADWAHVPSGTLHDVGFALIVVGFGAKVGLVPLQVWLPVGYPSAPGPTRAALAGLAANVGFYGLWRFLAILGRPPVWLAAAVLLVGGVTALLGITFAAVQPRLNRVIAYSSVENAGIIVVGYGVALAGAAIGQTQLIAIGLLAASLQVLAHAVAKSALFASSAFFETDFHTDHLDDLRGVGHTHRWSAVTFSVGSLTLAGLPPTIGFVSEWFILEALMQQFRVNGLTLRLAMAAAGALVALTAGVAALTFIRLLGLTILGRPSASANASENERPTVAAKAALAALAVSCLGLSAAAPWTIRFIARGLTPIVPATTVLGALKSPWVLQPVYAKFSILSPSWLFVTLPIGFLAVGAATTLMSRGGLLRVRRTPAWRSATAGVVGAAQYSSFGYANVVRHVLGNILGTRRSASHLEAAADKGEPGGAHIEVRSRVVEPIETYLYRPAQRVLLMVAGAAKRLQSGRLDAYISYMLVALLVVLAIVAALQ